MYDLYGGVYDPGLKFIFDSALHFTNNFRENCSLSFLFLFAVQNWKLQGQKVEQQQFWMEK